jgi:hypothetical protein
VFQDRFAVPSKWFHSAGFWPAFILISVMKRTDRRPQAGAPQPAKAKIPMETTGRREGEPCG